VTDTRRSCIRCILLFSVRAHHHICICVCLVVYLIAPKHILQRFLLDIVQKSEIVIFFCMWEYSTLSYTICYVFLLERLSDVLYNVCTQMVVLCHAKLDGVKLMPCHCSTIRCMNPLIEGNYHPAYIVKTADAFRPYNANVATAHHNFFLLSL
jgi:hypothetical protein